MLKIFFLTILIILKLTAPAFVDIDINGSNSFNGTLTEEYLLQLGFTFESTQIVLINHNITSIAPYAFVNFKKLDSLNLFYNQIEKVSVTTFKGKK